MIGPRLAYAPRQHIVAACSHDGLLEGRAPDPTGSVAPRRKLTQLARRHAGVPDQHAAVGAAGDQRVDRVLVPVHRERLEATMRGQRQRRPRSAAAAAQRIPDRHATIAAGCGKDVRAVRGPADGVARRSAAHAVVLQGRRSSGIPLRRGAAHWSSAPSPSSSATLSTARIIIIIAISHQMRSQRPSTPVSADAPRRRCRPTRRWRTSACGRCSSRSRALRPSGRDTQAAARSARARDRASSVVAAIRRRRRSSVSAPTPRRPGRTSRRIMSHSCSVPSPAALSAWSSCCSLQQQSNSPSGT